MRRTRLRGRPNRLGLRPIRVVAIRSRLVAAIAIIGLSIFVTASTSGATAPMHNCVPGPGADLEGCDFAHAFLENAVLESANLDDANLFDADLGGVTWSDTTCPDGTNSNDEGGTCDNDLG